MLGDNGAHSYVVGFGRLYPTYVQSMGASCPGTPSHPLVRSLNPPLSSPQCFSTVAQPVFNTFLQLEAVVPLAAHKSRGTSQA